MRAGDIVARWLKELDDVVDRAVVKTAENGKPVSCTTCTKPACCYQRVIVAPFEAMVIADRLRNEGRATPAFRERLRAAGEAMVTGTRAEYHVARQPCVFLEDGRCSVYEDRPVACRAYYVITPPEACDGPPGTQIAMLGVMAHAEDAAVKFSQFVADEMGLKQNRQRVYLETLPEMVLRVLDADTQDDPVKWLRRKQWPTADGLEAFVSEGRR